MAEPISATAAAAASAAQTTATATAAGAGAGAGAAGFATPAGFAPTGLNLMVILRGASAITTALLCLLVKPGKTSQSMITLP